MSLSTHIQADADDSTWWSLLSSGELHLACCRDCGGSWIRVTPSCPFCGSLNVLLKPSVCRGAIYSWVVVERPLGDVPIDLPTPYTVVMVDLEEGARVYGELSPDVAPEADLAVIGEVRGLANRPRLVFRTATKA